VPWSSDRSTTDAILSELAEIGAGRCSIDDGVIAAELDPDRLQILVGLLVLHEDLAYARQRQQQAQAAQEAATADRERLLEQLRQAVASRDQFLAVASHELRTPISTLTLQLDHLVDAVKQPGGPGTEQVVGQRIGLLQRQVQRLATLIVEMLDVARISGGRLDLCPSRVDLIALVREVLEQFQPEIARRKVNVSLTHDHGPVTAYCDPRRIDQVVVNLLSNALKYGGSQPVQVAVGCAGGRARIVVRDHGMGISAEDQRRLFEPFSRLAGSRHQQGLGVGLWIAQQFTRASGGDILVDSRPSDGSTFTVELPLAGDRS
jgi:signal transduction histidine kinase